MKAISAAILCSLLMALVAMRAQEAPLVQQPNQIGIPYLIESGTGKLIPLERQRVNSGVHIKCLGFCGGSTVVRFEGKTSPVRVKASGLRLATRSASMPPTPSAFITLDHLVSKKDSRESVLAKIGAFGAGSKSTNGDSEVELRFTPGENSVLFFEPAAPLPAGEYVVTLMGLQYGFLFRVD